MKQFNTFAANSPAFSSYYSPLIPTQLHFQSQQQSAYQLQKNHRHTRQPPTVSQHYHVQSQVHDPVFAKLRLDQRKYQTYQSRISLMKSNVSLPSTVHPEITPERFMEMENNITNCIFNLREQKITLMEQLIKKMDARNMIEQYINKFEIRKENQEELNLNVQNSKNNKNSKMQKHKKSTEQAQQFVPLHISAQVMKKNQELHMKLKEIQIKQQIFGPALQQSQLNNAKNQKILEEIIKIRELNLSLKQQISKKLTPKQQNQKSRFVTFVAQPQSKFTSLKNLLSQNQQLQFAYNHLLQISQQQHFTLTHQQNQYIQYLRRQNNNLLLEVQEMLRNKPFDYGNVANLKQHIAENQRSKQVFLRELQTFKQNMRNVKQKNDNLKKQLNQL